MSYREYIYAKASSKSVPLSGAFELSPLCNFACHMCYVRRTKAQLKERGQKEITADEWIALAKECREAGMLYLLLTGGEPFLYPEFRRLYDTLHQMGFLISINTNGTLIDDETVEWLKERAPERINITLYGSSREAYGRLCQNPSGYDRAVHAIQALHNAGMHVVVNSSITPENKDDLKTITDFIKENHVYGNIGTYMFPPVRRIREEEDSRLTPEDSGRLNVLKTVYRLNEKDLLKTAEEMIKDTEKAEEASDDTWGTDYEGEAMRCRAGRSTFWISWEGKMTACGMMEFPLVQYPFKDGFLNCWKKINEAVKASTVLAGCRNCPKKKICLPCAAMVYAETGTMDQKPEYLCAMADESLKCWKQIYNAMRGNKDE